jgi:hypothetical protein
VISFNFNLSNPWSNRFKNLYSTFFATPFKHKFIELEVLEDTTILSFHFRWATRQSHAGLMIELGILGYSFLFNFYDNRHWNYNEGRWMRYSEELGEH